MKENEEQRRHRLLHTRLSPLVKKLNKPMVYIIFLLLSFALGYLSSPTSRTPTPQQAQPPPLAFLKPSTSNIQFANLQNQLDNFLVKTQCAESIPPHLVRKNLIDRLFSGTSPYTDFPPAGVSQLLRRKRIKGWGSYGAVFENLINKVKPRVVIEVGTFLGASALHMANLTRHLGLDTQIFCIDDFRGWPGFRDKFKYVEMVNGDVLLYYQFLQNVVQSNATESVLPVPFSSGSALMKLCEWGIVADLIEIDAGHDFNSAWADINRAWRILRPGGVLFGHDYFTAADNRGVRRAVDLFAKINGLRVRADGEHWVIATTVTT